MLKSFLFGLISFLFFSPNFLPYDDVLMSEDEPLIEPETFEEEVVEVEDDFSDWKICENGALGIRLRYPPDWGECSQKINKFAIETSGEFNGEYLNVFFEKERLPCNLDTVEKTQQFIKDHKIGSEYTETRGGYVLRVGGYGGTIDHIVLVLRDQIYAVDFSVSDEWFDQNSAMMGSAGNWTRGQLEYTWYISTTIEEMETHGGE